MERIAVEGSSQVASMGYQEEPPVLEVEFKSRKGHAIYQYRNVTHAMWVELLRAPSKGAWLNANLKQNPADYPYQRVQ